MLIGGETGCINNCPATLAGEAIRIKPEIAGSSGIKRVEWSNDIGMNIVWIARTGWTFSTRIEAIAQPRENVEGESGPPRDDREETPPLRQALRTRVPQAVKWQIPSSAECDPVADVLITGGPEQTGIVGWDAAVPLSKPGDIVDAV